ncbi:MAG: flippase [Candidatus Latescibacteria bacterium]|nr:flippase [Candidatus Latescibacterota bacterium]
MRRLARNTVLLLAGNLSQAGLGLLTGVILARYLGATGFGQYAFVMTTVSVFGLFVELGFNTFLTRDVARDRRRATRYLLGSLIAKLGLTILTTIPYLLLVWGLGGHRDEQVLTAMCAGPILFLVIAFNASFASMFRAFEAMGDLLLLNVAAAVSQVAGLFGLATAGYGVTALVGWTVCVQVGRLGASWLLFRRLIGRDKRDGHDESLPGEASLIPFSLTLIKQAFPFGLASIIITLYARADILLLSFLAGDRAVGYYSAVYRFFDTLRMPPGAFLGAYLPVISRAGVERDRTGLIESCRTARSWLLVYGTGCALVVALLARPVVLWLYTEQFATSIPVLQVLIWALVPSVANDLTLHYFYAVGRERVAPTVMSLGLVVNVGLNLWLISRYGALGAAISMLVSEWILCVVFWREGNRHDHPV